MRPRDYVAMVSAARGAAVPLFLDLRVRQQTSVTCFTGTKARLHDYPRNWHFS